MTDQSKREKLKGILEHLLIMTGGIHGRGEKNKKFSMDEALSAIEALGYVEPLSEEDIRKIMNECEPDGCRRNPFYLSHAIAQAQRVGGRK